MIEIFQVFTNFQVQATKSFDVLFTFYPKEYTVRFIPGLVNRISAEMPHYKCKFGFMT